MLSCMCLGSASESGQGLYCVHSNNFKVATLPRHHDPLASLGVRGAIPAAMLGRAGLGPAQWMNFWNGV